MRLGCSGDREGEEFPLSEQWKAKIPLLGRRGLIAGLSLVSVLPACAAIVDEDTAERIFDSVGCPASHVLF
jgi:hypothetical protein